MIKSIPIQYQLLTYYNINLIIDQLKMKFVENFADILAKLQTFKVILLIFVDPSTLTPSESLMKYYSFNPIATQLSSNIFAYKGTQAKIFQFFNVLNYPQVTIIKEKPNNVLYNFIGCNQQKAWQSLGVLSVALGFGKPVRKLNTQFKYCPKQHQLRLLNEITQTAYRNGFFLCNGCNMLSHVQVDKPILHCGICQYDLCNNCSYIETIN